MKSKYSHMVIINLHETSCLEEVLVALSDEFVKETVIIDSNGIESRHENHYPNISTLLNLFKENYNQNYYISAIIEKKRIESLTEKLKGIKTKNKYVSSFWFIPIESYVYHKQKD